MATPNKRPINEVATIASTPQTTTLVVAGTTGAPPKRAEMIPSSIKPTIVKEASDQTSVSAGNSSIPMIGSIAPAINDSPEATDA